MSLSVPDVILRQRHGDQNLSVVAYVGAAQNITLAQNVERTWDSPGLAAAGGTRPRATATPRERGSSLRLRSSIRAKANPPWRVTSLRRNSSMIEVKLPVWNDFCASGVAAMRCASSLGIGLRVLGQQRGNNVGAILHVFRRPREPLLDGTIEQSIGEQEQEDHRTER